MHLMEFKRYPISTYLVKHVILTTIGGIAMTFYCFGITLDIVKKKTDIIDLLKVTVFM